MHDIDAIVAANNEAVLREYAHAVKSQNFTKAVRIKSANKDFISGPQFRAYLREQGIKVNGKPFIKGGK